MTVTVCPECQADDVCLEDQDNCPWCGRRYEAPESEEE